MGSIPTRSRQLRRGTTSRAGLVLAPALLWGLLWLAAPLAAVAQEPRERPALGAPDSASVAAPEAEGAADESGEPEGAANAGEPEDADVARPAAPGPPTRQEVGPGRVPVSPMGAFLRSVVLPGWGQVSVDQPGRGAFYFVMEAGSLYMLLKSQARLDAVRRELDPDPDLIESREEQVEDWAVMAGFWALFAGIDAWVSAHLWDFEGEVLPPPDGSPGAALRYSVPVGP
ncbi:MAG: hypothetical protein RRA92_09615 [Gemmatimonadota bacterium]|nr:hypothetical protein [Gemmatimonadota bacterium]